MELNALIQLLGHACFAAAFGATLWFFFVQSPTLLRKMGRDAFVPLQMRLTVVLFRFLSVVLLIGLAATAATRGLHALPVRCASLAVAAVLINTFVVVPRALRAGGRGRQEVRGRDHEGTVTHFASAGVGQSTKIFHRLVVLFVVVMLLGIGGSLTLLITG